MLVDYLIYSSYRFNRGEGMTAEGLRRIFGPQADAMEAKYQEELATEQKHLLYLDFRSGARDS